MPKLYITSSTISSTFNELGNDAERTNFEDNSKDFGAPLQFVLGAGQVIPGWEQGFDNINIGGIRTISIPPEFAYGAEQVGPIPPNSTLIFTVEVVDAVSLDTQ